MRYELFISLRYLKAKRKQIFISVITILSIGGVGLGVMALVVVLSVMSGFEDDLKTKILGTNAHLVVLQHGSPMRDYGEVIRRVEGIQGVLATTPFIFSQAMLTSENNVHGIILRGIDPNTAGRVINIESTLKKGSMESLKREDQASGPPGILLGKELAQTLGVMLDDTVVVVSPLGALSPMGSGSPMKKFRVRGIFDSGMYEYDTGLLDKATAVGSAVDNVAASVGSDGAGNIVIAYTGPSVTSGTDVYTFTGVKTAPVVDHDGPLVADVTLPNGNLLLDGGTIPVTSSGPTNLIVAFGENLNTDAQGQANYAHSVLNPLNWKLYRSGNEIIGAVTSVTFAYNPL
ncbi:MAG: ABC transporter permease, partial [Thermodesulfobacteriota bacterium]